MVRPNRPIGRETTVDVKNMVEQVQMLVRERKRVFYNVAAEV